MAETTVKRNDRFPALESTLSENAKAINLEAPVNALAVELHIKKVGGSMVPKAAAFVSKTSGTVKYEWEKADAETTGVLNVPGEYQYEWVVEWAAGETEHFPTKGFKTLLVEEQLAP